MTEMIIQYNEEMVGANHPTKSDTLNRALLVEHNEKGTHQHYRGWRRGLQIQYKDADEIYVGAGEVSLDDGTTPRTYTLAAQTAKAHAITGGPKVVYVYVDPPASGTSLAAENIVLDDTVPAWNEGKHGWYHPTNTDQRWLEQAFAIDASNNVLKFVSSAEGKGIYWVSAVLIIAAGNAVTWTEVDLSSYVPAIEGVRATVPVRLLYQTANSIAYLRTKGTSGNGWNVAQVHSSGRTDSSLPVIPVDSAGKLQYLLSNSGAELNIYVGGWTL